jgi:hypothetical protein
MICRIFGEAHPQVGKPHSSTLSVCLSVRLSGQKQVTGHCSPQDFAHVAVTTTACYSTGRGRGAAELQIHGVNVHAHGAHAHERAPEPPCLLMCMSVPTCVVAPCMEAWRSITAHGARAHGAPSRRAHLCVRVCACAHGCVCARTGVCVHARLCMRVGVCVRVSVHGSVCVCVCVRARAARRMVSIRGCIGKTAPMTASPFSRRFATPLYLSLVEEFCLLSWKPRVICYLCGCVLGMSRCHVAGHLGTSGQSPLGWKLGED